MELEQLYHLRVSFHQPPRTTTLRDVPLLGSSGTAELEGVECVPIMRNCYSTTHGDPWYSLKHPLRLCNGLERLEQHSRH